MPRVHGEEITGALFAVASCVTEEFPKTFSALDFPNLIPDPQRLKKGA